MRNVATDSFTMHMMFPFCLYVPYIFLTMGFEMVLSFGFGMVTIGLALVLHLQFVWNSSNNSLALLAPPMLFFVIFVVVEIYLHFCSRRTACAAFGHQGQKILATISLHSLRSGYFSLSS